MTAFVLRMFFSSILTVLHLSICVLCGFLLKIIWLGDFTALSSGSFNSSMLFLFVCLFGGAHLKVLRGKFLSLDLRVPPFNIDKYQY